MQFYIEVNESWVCKLSRMYWDLPNPTRSRTQERRESERAAPDGRHDDMIESQKLPGAGRSRASNNNAATSIVSTAYYSMSRGRTYTMRAYRRE